MNVAEYLLQHSSSFSAPCLLASTAEFTFGQLDNAAECVAQWLERSGVQKGDRALLCAENSFFWVASYLGSLRAGCVVVPLAPSSTTAEFGYIRETTSPVAFFFDRHQTNRALSLLGQDRYRFICDGPIPSEAATSQVTIAFTDLLRGGYLHRSRPSEVDDRQDLAAIMFTSGSTGTPRGVMVSHRNIIANTESIVQYMRLSHHERVMTVLPFHYCFGTSLLHTHLRVGASLVIGENFVYPDKTLQRMAETQCSGFAGVPSHLQILLRLSSLNEARLPHLRWIQQAGGKLAVPFIQELRTAMPSLKLFVMYGQTEATARLSYLPPELLDRKMGSIGKGIPGVGLEVLREDGTAVAPGEIGQIVATGENIALGYWRNPTETARCFREGKLYTGDLATVDEEGYIYIVDRAKDFLKCGGYRVSARQIEEVLLQSEDVVEAAVIGMPDDILGEAVMAFVVPRKPHVNGSMPRSGPEMQKHLVHFCRQHLPHHTVPRHIVFMEFLPKNEAGKVLKQALRAHHYCDDSPAGGIHYSLAVLNGSHDYQKPS